MAAKRFPLPKRFSAAMSEKAYERLRKLSEKYGYGNNYLLTFIFENFDRIADLDEVEKVFAEYKAEYGAPEPGGMKDRNPERKRGA
ncbi:MAG: hypothetical protein IPM63_08195 [Acidobacteriota bacterium]|nr:MAG: hypothetical protein IPM63_08195 [Acidobacteriota bacterium]